MRTAILLLALILAGCPSTDEDPFGDCTDADGDGYCSSSDCLDDNAEVHPDAEEVCNDKDDNCDGLLSDPEIIDADSDGHVLCKDCNDEDANSYPEAEELCDGIDNDCEDGVPEDEVDGDNDGHLGCVDCDDTNPDIAPGLEEVECDGIDTNCDGVLFVQEDDPDGDGWTGCDGDCGPDDPTIYPGADELCNTIDNDCDGALGADELDVDSDGFGECAGDCDDDDPGIRPELPEACDGVDTDCNGLVDGVDDQGNPEDTDVDGDGFSVCGGDCNDDNSAVAPGEVELCDGLDNDCNGALDGMDAEGNPETLDLDGDGAPACADCDDEDITSYPGAPEACDGIDTDCNGLVDGVDANGDPEDTDIDQDGFSPCAGDCDDGDSDINPNGVDSIDGGDGNCDGIIGADNVGFTGWAGTETDVLAELQFECDALGLTPTQIDFDTGLHGAPMLEPAVTFSSIGGGGGPTDIVYGDATDGTTPRSGSLYLRPVGPTLNITIEFDSPQTMVAAATIPETDWNWGGYTVELASGSTVVDTGPLFVDVDPGLDWGFRGWMSNNGVGFDTITLDAAQDDVEWVLDDLWFCF